MQEKQDISKNLPPCHFLLIESYLKIQKKGQCFKELASWTINISLLGYMVLILR